MASPVQLPDLPVATSASNSDTTLLRQGLTDFQCSLGLIRNINIASFTTLNAPSNALSTDKLLISRLITGVPTNFSINFDAVGLPMGTKSWFYMSSAALLPLMTGWQIVPNTGDSMLAVAGGTTYNAGGTAQGAWTLPAITLGIQNIPQHSHYIPANRSAGSGSSNAQVAGGTPTGSIPDWIESFSTGGQGSTLLATNPSSPGSRPTFTGTPVATVPYALGNTWRPFASVGVIAVKNV